MKLLPYRKTTVTTKLTKEEVLEKIRQNTAKPDLFNPRGSTQFSGIVNPESFKIRRNLDYKNSFVPFMTGRFLQHQTHTTIEVTFKPLEFFIGFMILWLGAVTCACIGVLYISLTDEKGFSAPMLIPFGMLIFGTILFSGAFAFEYPKSKAALLDLIEAEEIQAI